MIAAVKVLNEEHSHTYILILPPTMPIYFYVPDTEYYYDCQYYHESQGTKDDADSSRSVVTS